MSQLAAVKLSRLKSYLEEGGDDSPDAVKKVLRVRKPELVDEYIAAAKAELGQGGEAGEAGDEGPSSEVAATSAPASTTATDPTPTPPPVKDTPATATTPTPTPSEDTSDECKRACCEGECENPAPRNPSDFRYRVLDDKGIVKKLEITRVKGSTVFLQEVKPKDMVKIMVKGSVMEVDLLDQTLSPDIRAAALLAKG